MKRARHSYCAARAVAFVAAVGTLLEGQSAPRVLRESASAYVAAPALALERVRSGARAFLV